MAVLPDASRSLCSITLALALLVPANVATAAPAHDPFADAPVEVADAPAEPTEAREVPIVRVEASEDEVILLDGSFVRGKIAELAKGSHVTIDSGERRTIPWAEVQEVRVASPATQPTAVAEPAPAETPPSESKPSSEPEGLRVTMVSRNGAPITLYRVEGEFEGGGAGVSISGIAYRAVCSGTCDRVIDGSSGSGFFVGGERLTPSRHFTLSDEVGDVTLLVRPGKRAVRYTGILFTIFGGALIPSAIMLMALGTRSSRPDRGTVAAGAGMMVGGVVLLGAGIPLALLGRTRVEKRRYGR